MVEVSGIVKKKDPLITAVFEDKADSSQRNEDRAKLAETSRHVFDTIRKKYGHLDNFHLRQLIIPSVHTAGNIVDFYLLKWSGKVENCYLFYHVAQYDIREKEGYIAACQRMWNILNITKKNVNIIRQVYDDIGNQKMHHYVKRIHRDGPPTSSPSKKSSLGQSGGSNKTTNTPTKPNINNNNNEEEEEEQPIEWEKVQQCLVEKGHTVLETITTGDREAVFSCFETRKKEIIKVTNNSHELSILQKIHGQHHIIKLLRHFEITAPLPSQQKSLICLVLPFVQDTHVTSESQLRTFATQLIDAMVFLHKSGIYHRDIKRNNIVFDGKQLYLIDFDLSFQMDISNQKPPKGRVGTYGYMAPEVLEGLESGYPADTWSAGVAIIEEFYWWKKGEVGSLFVRQSRMKDVLSSLKTLCKTANLHKMFDLVQRMVEPNPQRRISDDEIVMAPFIAGESKIQQYTQDKENVPPNQTIITQKKAKVELHSHSLVC